MKISLDNGATWNPATNTIGATTYSYAATLTGINTLQVRVEDAAGNYSTPKVQAYQYDPNPPIITISAIGGTDSIVSGVAGDAIVTGTADANSTVNITRTTGGTLLGTATTDASGNYSYTLTGANITTLGQNSGDSITVTQTDTAGNTGTSAAFAITNVDTVDPTVNTFSPTLGQGSGGVNRVSTSANIVITFAENIALDTGNITIRSTSSTGIAFETYNVATNTNNLFVSGATLTINPGGTSGTNLTSNRTYYVVIDATAITDTAGNAYAGTSSYNFATPIVLDLNGDGVQYVDPVSYTHLTLPTILRV